MEILEKHDDDFFLYQVIINVNNEMWIGQEDVYDTISSFIAYNDVE